MERLVEILRKAVSDGASDIFIVAGGALSYKVDGEIRPMEASAERLMPDDTKVLLDEIYECASREKTHFLEEGDDDFSFAIEDLARFRVNSYFQRGSQAAVIRVVSFRIPDYKDLGIPEGGNCSVETTARHDYYFRNGWKREIDDTSMYYRCD